VLDDFKLLMGTADSKLTTDNLERLANACLVINALGPKVGGPEGWMAGWGCGCFYGRVGCWMRGWYRAAVVGRDIGGRRTAAPGHQAQASQPPGCHEVPGQHWGPAWPAGLRLLTWAPARAPVPQVREQLMDWLCEREMTIYTTIFSMAGESAKLDRFDRRYQWFRARLEEKKVGDGPAAGGQAPWPRPPGCCTTQRSAWSGTLPVVACAASGRSKQRPKAPPARSWLSPPTRQPPSPPTPLRPQEQWVIFPESWRVPQTLCLTFCKITRAHLKRVLSDGEEAQRGPAEVRDGSTTLAAARHGPCTCLGTLNTSPPPPPLLTLHTPRPRPPTAQVGPLIKTVVATNKFEKEMAQLFGGGGAGEAAAAPAVADGKPASFPAAPPNPRAPTAAQARRRRTSYRRRATT
jgi:hypothetical protein